MFNDPVVFVDIETSGTGYKSSRIIEIAAIRVEDNKIVDELHTLINPHQLIPHWINQLTGISQSDLRDAPYFEDIAYRLNEFLKDAIFVAHNVRFDYSFVKNQLNGCGYTYNPKLLCTVRLSRALFPEYKGHSLEKIIKRHKIKVSARHRAYDDARAIYDFSCLAHSLKGEAAFTEAISRQLKSKTLPPNLDESQMTDVPNKPGVYVFEDAAGKPLYVGKSINLRTRVLSHFAQDTKIAKEMKISQGTHKLRTIETETELEALLLESQMIKELLPIYNKKLRRSYNQTVFLKSIDEAGYTNIELANKDLSKQKDFSNIYGVYSNKLKAKASLESLLRTYQLCPKLLGLEKSKTACFRYQLKRCRGACIGKESPESYNQRVEWALAKSRIASWPYDTPIMVQLNQTKSIVVDQWIITGYLESMDDGEPNFISANNVFEADTYRILRSFLKNKRPGLNIAPYVGAMMPA